MARTYTRESLGRELARAQARGWEACCVEAERRVDLPRALLLAIASRETDMDDVVGDGGHGRGLFQIDDRSHRTFLLEHGAGGTDGKPPVRDAARYAAQLVRDNLEFARRKGVSEPERLKFALSAYNAGPGNAHAGWQAGDSDARTTGADYGRDVLRRHEHFRALVNGGPTSALERGSRGGRVEELKGKLADWYGRNAPGEFERFGVKPGPVFGAALEQAVLDFQRRKGLKVDGVVGPKTLAALER
ncbi:MAG: peptidoglycan-binding protein [Actinobacteria bacterium]|nr:peptidoglycan-binding protein [Actinomycetota bacterium]